MRSLSRLGPLGRVNGSRIPKQLSEHIYTRKKCFIDSLRRAMEASPPAQIPTRLTWQLANQRSGQRSLHCADQKQRSGPLLFCVSGTAYDFIWKMCSKPLK